MKAVMSKNAPAPIGPYNQAVLADDFLFVSGCLGLDPTSGELKEGIELQAKQAMDNLVSILKEGCFTTSNIVKTTVFLNDINDFNKFNEIYASYFDGTWFPSRTCVEVSKLPKNALLEIEAIAYKG